MVSTKSRLALVGSILSLTTLVSAHGFVQGIVIDGKYYQGYIVNAFPYESNPPAVIGWSTTATDLDFVSGTAYATPDIICHRGSKPGNLSAPVAVGGTVELQWSPWPDTHKGPVINYLAECANADCTKVDKTTLEFFKIDQAGLLNDTTVPGKWATDVLIANNNSYTVTIPASIKPGNYVLRHEIIALHGAMNKDGAQNYPQCINLQVTGSGTAVPSGTAGEALYKDTDPGISVDIFEPIATYTIPGPALYTGT